MPALRSIAPEDNGYTPIASRVLPMWAIAKTEASRTGKLRRRTLPVFMSVGAITPKRENVGRVRPVAISRLGTCSGRGSQFVESSA